jgi:hypothetical protein
MATYEIQVGEDRWRVDVPDEVEGDEATLNTFLTQTAASLEKGEGYSLGEEPVEEEGERSFFDKAGDVLKAGGSIASGVVGSAAGGLAMGSRLIENAFRGGFEEEENSGKYFYEDELADAVAHGQAVQNDLTYTPESQGAQDNWRRWEDVRLCY